MVRCPFAIWKPLPANNKQARMTPRLSIMHTAVDAPGETDLYNWFVQSGLESHFFIQLDGDLLQYMDTEIVAEANYKANLFAISTETEDEGRPATLPWNDKQLARLIQLNDWLCRTHPTIKRQQANKWDGSGIGWHSMWGINTRAAPNLNPWTSVLGKTCPAPPRIQQMKDIIIPSVIKLGSQSLEGEVITAADGDLIWRTPIERTDPITGQVNNLEAATWLALAEYNAVYAKKQAEANAGSIETLVEEIKVLKSMIASLIPDKNPASEV